MMKTLYALCLALTLVSVPAHGVVAHIGTGCSASGTGTSGTNSYTFACTPTNANDAVTFIVGCTGGGTATNVSLTASGWTITLLNNILGTPTAGFAAIFGAITPNTSATTFTVTFTGSSDCSTFTIHQSDEFTGVDTTGGTTTFDAHNQNSGTTGGCTGAAITPTNSNDGVWYGCVDSVTAITGGYTVGQNDAGGDQTEFKILSGGSGVAQNPSYTSSGAFLLGGTTIKAAGSAASGGAFSSGKSISGGKFITK